MLNNIKRLKDIVHSTNMHKLFHHSLNFKSDWFEIKLYLFTPELYRLIISNYKNNSKYNLLLRSDCNFVDSYDTPSVFSESPHTQPLGYIDNQLDYPNLMDEIELEIEQLILKKI
jgi:hypothetical protein